MFLIALFFASVQIFFCSPFLIWAYAEAVFDLCPATPNVACGGPLLINVMGQIMTGALDLQRAGLELEQCALGLLASILLLSCVRAIVRVGWRNYWEKQAIAQIKAEINVHYEMLRDALWRARVCQWIGTPGWRWPWTPKPITGGKELKD